MEKAPHWVPSMRALIAFECAARQGSFSRAAAELGASQPAISRHIANLEEQLGTRLFDRSRSGVAMTDAGRRFCEAVVTGLGIIRTAAIDAAGEQQAEQVVIACSHDASQFFVLPRYQALQRSLGEHVRIRILTFQYDARQLPLDPTADLILTWDSNVDGEDYVVVHGEAVRPVCAPGYAAAHAEALALPVDRWGGLTFLDLLPPNSGWASWDDWFRAAGRPDTGPRFKGFDGYAYVLEAAVAGDGIALGWRHFVDRHIESGALIPLTEEFVEFRSRYCALLTDRGRDRDIARRCLSFFENCV